MTFHSSNYLPNLAFHHEYKMERKPFRFDDVDLLVSVTSSIIRCRLSFMSDQQSFAQLALLEILMSKFPMPICFLAKTWEMYTTPFSTVFNSASRSNPVPVLSPSGLKPRTGPVPESFRNQGPRTRTTKNRKKPVQTVL